MFQEVFLQAYTSWLSRETENALRTGKPNFELGRSDLFVELAILSSVLGTVP
jgi:hypothetical protein